MSVTTRLPRTLSDLGDRAEALGGHALRYGLVLILLWIGGMKFTAYEAEGIRPFVENSPLFAWTYPVFGVQGGRGRGKPALGQRQYPMAARRQIINVSEPKCLGDRANPCRRHFPCA